jgi:hypothetical protein
MAAKPMAVVEHPVAGASTAASPEGPADFMAARSMARLVDFTVDLLDFPMAGFTAAHFILTGFRTASFTLMNFTASGSITMASTAAQFWPQSLVGCG